MLETVWDLILSIIAIIIILIFAGSIYAFFYAIGLFVFSAWDNEKIKKAWNSIRYMIIGILLTLFFLFIFPLLFQRLNVPQADQFTAQGIFSRASTIITWLLNFWRDAANTYQNSDGAVIYPQPLSPTSGWVSSWAWATSWQSPQPRPQPATQVEL